MLHFAPESVLTSKNGDVLTLVKNAVPTLMEQLEQNSSLLRVNTCDECEKLKDEIAALKTTINRINNDRYVEKMKFEEKIKNLEKANGMKTKEIKALKMKTNHQNQQAEKYKGVIEHLKRISIPSHVKIAY